MMSSKPEPSPARPKSSIGQALRATIEVATAGAVLATVVGFAGRLSWLCELACHFRVQYFCSLAAAALVLGLTRRIKMAVIAATFACVNGALIAPLYLAGAPPTDNVARTPLKVLSLNVHSANREHDLVIKFVRATAPDVAVFLEVNDEWGSVLDGLTDTYPFRQIRTRSGNFGIALYSRLPLVDSSIFELSDRCPAVKGTVELGSRTVTIVGIHPYPPMSAEAAELRQRQYETLARQAGTADVIVGDFNTTSWSPVFADLVQSTGLRDSRQGFGVQPSWPDGNWLLQIPIDHCLVSHELVVTRREVGPGLGSDHLPVFVDLLVPER